MRGTGGGPGARSREGDPTATLGREDGAGGERQRPRLEKRLFWRSVGRLVWGARGGPGVLAAPKAGDRPAARARGGEGAQERGCPAPACGAEGRALEMGVQGERALGPRPEVGAREGASLVPRGQVVSSSPAGGEGRPRTRPGAPLALRGAGVRRADPTQPSTGPSAPLCSLGPSLPRVGQRGPSPPGLGAGGLVQGQRLFPGEVRSPQRPVRAPEGRAHPPRGGSSARGRLRWTRGAPAPHPRTAGWEEGGCN